ncbi:MAG: DUF3813 domain-containing protein [Bacillus sp. (in: firmicutes)]
MGNKLFQQAHHWVNEAKQTGSYHKEEIIAKAQNALSSAYANSTVAEQAQLREMQDELDSLQ